MSPNRMFHIAIALVAALLLAGCDGHDHAHEEPGHAHEAGQATALQLNDGQRWAMDDHTRESMHQLDAILSEEAPATPEGYRRMGERLHETTRELIAGCTMQGPAHDQLHIYLGELLPRIATLRETDDAAAGESILAELRTGQDRFHHYFQ